MPENRVEALRLDKLDWIAPAVSRRRWRSDLVWPKFSFVLSKLGRSRSRRRSCPKDSSSSGSAAALRTRGRVSKSDRQRRRRTRSSRVRPDSCKRRSEGFASGIASRKGRSGTRSGVLQKKIHSEVIMEVDKSIQNNGNLKQCILLTEIFISVVIICCLKFLKLIRNKTYYNCLIRVVNFLVVI